MLSLGYEKERKISLPSLLKAGQFRQQAGYGDGPYYRILPRTKPAETYSEPDEDVLAARLEAERQANQERALRERLREEGRQAGYQEGQSIGYRDGYDAGHREALTQVMAAEQAELERLADLGRQLTDSCSEWLQSFEARGVELAVAIAEKVLQAELGENPGRIETLAAQVLHAYRDKSPRVLTVSPRTRERLLKSERLRQVLMELPAPVEILAADAFSDGDCMLDTPDCRVDAGMNAQLERIRRGLMEEMDE